MLDLLARGDGDAIVLLFYIAFYGIGGTIMIWALARVILAAHFRRKGLQSGKGLRKIALALGGTVEPAPYGGFPYVAFTRNRAKCWYIQYVIGTSDVVVSAIEACIAAEGFFEASSRDSRRIPTAYPRAREFAPKNQEFKFVSTDPGWGLRTLTDGLKELLEELHRQVRAPVRVQLTPARMTLEVESLRVDPLLLVGYLDKLAALLEDRVDDTKVRVLATGFDPSRGRCPVCAIKLDGSPTLCGKCRTPHHADCWNYAGRCAIFGCGSRNAG
jgi:hypothetical protein